MPNGGADLIYLSPTDFATPESKRAVLQKIVNFAEAQEWCGPIFSRDPAEGARRTGAPRHIASARRSRISDGSTAPSASASSACTMPARSPDLVISFREEPDADNKALTGPGNPAFLIGQIGQVSTPNKSAELVHPVKGVVYADTGTSQTFTTGMGMHGAAGEREIHNFCAATGPDFRRGFVDLNPTANTDVAPTITQILGTMPNIGPGGVVPDRPRDGRGADRRPSQRRRLTYANDDDQPDAARRRSRDHPPRNLDRRRTLSRQFHRRAQATGQLTVIDSLSS